MERFNALGRGMQIMLVGAVLLVIDLFLPWQDFGGAFADELGIDATFSGWRGIGAVLGVATIVVIGWVVLRLVDVDLGNLPVSMVLITVVLGALVLVLGVIKWLTIIDDEATIWAWIGLALAVLIGIGAWLHVQAAGGIEALREVRSVPAAEAQPPMGAPPPAAPAEPPVPSEPRPPVEPADAPDAGAPPEPEELPSDIPPERG